MNLFNQDMDRELLFRQYEALLRGKENNEERRIKTSQFYVSAMTAIAALVGLSRSMQMNIPAVYVVVIAVVGIVCCLLWHRTMKTFRVKAKVKYQLLQEIETRLPANLFAMEYQKLDEQGAGKMFRISRIEGYVPIVFMLLFMAIIIAVITS